MNIFFIKFINVNLDMFSMLPLFTCPTLRVSEHLIASL